MIDSNTIKQLALIIKDYSNNHIASNIAKKKINGIFHNKSISTIFRELKTYIFTRSLYQILIFLSHNRIFL